MTIGSSSSHFLQEMTYPPYCIQPLKSWGMIAVGGGGGTAKTGVSNAVDLKWIYLNQSADPENNKCSIQNVNSFKQHDSVMRMVSLHKRDEYLILALNRHLKVILLKPSKKDSEMPLNHTDLLPVSKTRRRRLSSTASDKGATRSRSSSLVLRRAHATVEAIGNETSIAIIPSSITPTTCSTSFVFPMNSSSTAILDSNIYTVPIPEQEYVNAIAICPATQSKLFVGLLLSSRFFQFFFVSRFLQGASDGSLQIYEIIWPAISSSSDRLIQLNLLTSFSTHSKEIDDIAVDLFGNWLITVSRDLHVQIRQCSSPFDKHGELNIQQFGMNKSATPPKPLYRIRHVRFGYVPKSSKTKSFLYTSLIPQSNNDKLSNYIVQWYENAQHQFIVRQRRAVSYDRLSATAVSNCGSFVAIGDAGGCVRIYGADRLNLLYKQRSHEIFVTDLAFVLREENYLYATSVLSISADKNLYVHNVEHPTINLSSSLFLILIGLLLFFFSFSQIRFTFQ